MGRERERGGGNGQEEGRGAGGGGRGEEGEGGVTSRTGRGNDTARSHEKRLEEGQGNREGTNS